MMLSHSLIAAGSKVFKLIITAASNTDLRTAALAAGWNGSSKVLAELGAAVQRAGVTVSGSFPGGVELLIPAGTVIYGVGGAGGPRIQGNNSGDRGSQGGTALIVTVPLTVTNLGTLVSGGGGGGGGGGAQDTFGARYYGGAGGTGASYVSAATAGVAGDVAPDGSRGGNGGNGGGMTGFGGNGGTSQSWATGGGSRFDQGGGSGGAPGNAVTGNSNITWLATGTRSGTVA